jgi:hypothetical protein
VSEGGSGGGEGGRGAPKSVKVEVKYVPLQRSW